jgi:hypothetical protein
MPKQSNLINYVDLERIKVDRFTWKKIVEKLPYHDLKEEDLIRIIRSSDGMKVVSTAGRPYNIVENRDNVDQWVKEALWHYDQDLYNSIRGYTKSARVGRVRHSLLKYCGPVAYKKQLFTDPKFTSIYDEQIQKLSDMFKKSDPLSLDAALNKVPLSGAAGYNYPGKTKGDVLPQAAKTVRDFISVFSKNREPEHIPYKLGLRGHLSPEDQNKSRAIWMGAVETNIMENMLFRPFYNQVFNSLQFVNLILTGDKSMERLHEYVLKDQHKTFVNTDVSGWDAMRCRFLIKDIFSKVLRPNINFEFNWQENMFNFLEDDFIKSYLALPSGVIIQKETGIPSGSFLTLLINSIMNFVVQTSILRYLEIQFYHEKVLGDDFSFIINRLEEYEFQDFVSRFSDVCWKFFRLKIKDESVIITNDVNKRKFIGYRICNGRLYREDEELFCGILYPESEVQSLRVSFTRVFAFFIIGGCNSNRFLEFYETFLSGYYKELQKYGNELFNIKVMSSGNLRVFKHVYNIDLSMFETFSIETFRNIFSDKAPYFLTYGLNFFI